MASWLHAALFLMPMQCWPVQAGYADATDLAANPYGFVFVFIHGFRMPVFFLLSGFFAAMLWRRRGLAALTSRFLDPDRLPYDRLTLSDFGAFWSAMIERADRMFAHLPPERLLNLRFEDVLADPVGQTRRLVGFIDPGLEDEAWLRGAARVPRPAPSRFALLGAEERARLTEACRPGLERLGYPV